MPETNPEWGKMRRGQRYVILATDILRAIFALGLGPVEGSIVMLIIENTWGRSARRRRQGQPWPETEPYPLDNPRASRSLGYPVQRIQEARSRLVSSHIILNVNGGVLINKDVDSWTKPDGSGPRLASGLLEYARSAQTRSGADASEFVDTVDRVEKRDISISVDTVQRVASEFVDTVDRVISISVDTVNRVSPIDEARTELRPYGVNTDPTGLKTDTAAVCSEGALRSPKKTRPEPLKQRGLALSDDEPFISPPDAPPLPAPRPDDPETVALVRNLHPFMIKATTSPDYPDGNGDVAEFMVRKAREWRSLGYAGITIRDVVKQAVQVPGLASNSIPLCKWIVKALNGHAATATPKPFAKGPGLPPVNHPDPATAERTRSDRRRASEAEKALLGRWQALTDMQRGEVEAEFDRDNRRPDDIPAKLWPAMRRQGCLELFGARSAEPGQTT